MAYINNQIKKDHYVYLLRDSDLIVRYVGQGRGVRYKQKSNRSQEYLTTLNNGGRIEIVCNGLNKLESQSMEAYFIEKYKNTIFNVQKHSIVKNIEFEKFKDIFIIDQNSISGLSWKNKIRNVRNTRAGSINKNGYYSVSYKGSLYKVHRIVWCLHNQKDLDANLVVHHLDGNSSNNHPENLKAVTYLENVNAKINIGKPFELLGITMQSKKGTPNARLSVVVYIDGVRHQKEFSLFKYSQEEALSLALKWKSMKLEGIKNV